MSSSFFAHPTADVSPDASIGEGTKIWQHCQIRERASIGKNCVISKGVYIDSGVVIGNNVKIQNGISIYNGVTLEDGVFCGPHSVFTNDAQPRGINPDGTLKSSADWVVSTTIVRMGAALGAHATVVCGLTIGRWAMVGAGAVVTRDVPDFALVFGNPARIHGFVCPCGERLVKAQGTKKDESSPVVEMVCPKCKTEVAIPRADYARIRS